jgi:hypothetical protein
MTINTVVYEFLFRSMSINALCSCCFGFIGAFVFSYCKTVFQQVCIDSLPMQERKLVQEVHDKRLYENYSTKMLLEVAAVFIFLLICLWGLL